MGKKHFVRILKRAQVNELTDMLNEAAGRKFPHVTAEDDTFEVKAPDGDVVFAGIKANSGAGHDTYICRMHREVFDEKSAGA